MKTLLTVLALGLALPAAAHDYLIGNLAIAHPVLRVASPVSKTGAGYLAITNSGKTADRLVSVTTTAANRADLHGTVQSGGVMQMRAQTGGVPVPAGATVRFAPGGLHVMFIGLKAAMPVGTPLKARLQFEKAGAIDLEFKTETIAGGQQP
jgi:periplasmic copper chaperone A